MVRGYMSQRREGRELGLRLLHLPLTPSASLTPGPSLCAQLQDEGPSLRRAPSPGQRQQEPTQLSIHSQELQPMPVGSNQPFPPTLPYSSPFNSLARELLHAKSLQSRPILCDPVDQGPPGSSVHGSGWPCPPPGIFPAQGLTPPLSCLLHWHVGSLPLVPPGKPLWIRSSSIKHRASQVVLAVKNPPANAGDVRDAGSIPGSGEGRGDPLQCSCLENPVDRRAWRTVVHRVAQSQTGLKWLSIATNKQLFREINPKLRAL